MSAPTHTAESPHPITLSTAPWTDEEVKSLQAYQLDGTFHPFTWDNDEVLIPTNAGWVRVVGGPVVQTWAHVEMTTWAWNDWR